MVVLNDIHIDIMDYISPATCADVAFRNMCAMHDFATHCAACCACCCSALLRWVLAGCRQSGSHGRVCLGCCCFWLSLHFTHIP